jgi:hypothetical protein
MFRQTAFYWSMSNPLALIYEILMGVLRLLLLVFSCLIFAIWSIRTLDGIDTWIIAEQIRIHSHPFFSTIPTVFWQLLVPFWDWQYARYLFAPLSAFLFIFISAAFYVRDIYHLPTLGRAFHYVTSSLFGIFYPRVQIDGGRINGEDPNDESDMEEKHLLRALGGPGFVLIQPGNAVAFRDWQELRGIQSNRLYFMRPFEMIARVVNLEDQQGHIDESPAITRDGIRLRLKNIDYRYCVSRQPKEKRNENQEESEEKDKLILRRPDTPYPFSEEAINSIAYSFSVSDKGLESWHQAVNRSVDGALVTFITSHDLDYLTAPRQDEQNPRRELRTELFDSAVRNSLRKAGAELHWMDIGHFDIDDLESDKEQDPVDQTRTRRWAAHWIGNAKTIRSYGEAKRIVYQELARAEAQAELVMCITDALRDVSFGPDQADTLRQIFLARTAQILDALQDSNSKKEKPS